MAKVRCEALSVQHAAVLLDVHENTIRNWMRVGEIVAVRMPGKRLWRIPVSEIQRIRAGATT